MLGEYLLALIVVASHTHTHSTRILTSHAYSLHTHTHFTRTLTPHAYSLHTHTHFTRILTPHAYSLHTHTHFTRTRIQIPNTLHPLSFQVSDASSGVVQTAAAVDVLEKPKITARHRRRLERKTSRKTKTRSSPLRMKLRNMALSRFRKKYTCV